MASSQLVCLYQRLYVLPALSLVFLTGFTFSFSLPSALQALTPSMESLFLVFLPHLWKSFLSWVTPPCLFVLLNGIIMILTATSGSFSRSASSSGGSDSNSTLQKQIAALEPSSAIVDELQAVNDTPPLINPPIQGALQLEGPIVSQLEKNDIPATNVCLHAEDAVLEELPKEVSSSGGDDGNEDQDQDIMDKITSQEVRPELTIEIVDPYEIDGDDPSSSSFEEAVKGGSEPSSPHFSSSPGLKNSIRRACSIDSASLIDNEAPSEYLSDDAFKKRIEDFIFKVNSKLRSETRL